MSGTDSARDPKKGAAGNANQQTSKVPRQVKVKDSRQIQTERDGADYTEKRKGDYREAAKAVGKGNREILDTVRAMPGAIEVERFVMSRAFEITSMKSAMKAAAATATTRAFQSLPRHLRRRAASHNPRRVPKRLREKAAFEIDSKDSTVKSQKKRAKAKARFLKKKGLSKTDIYLKRQTEKTWLETHVWHAKRMKMENVCGYRIARTPNRKSHRPAHRAAHSGCVIHDASYYSILELMGSRDELVEILSGCVAGGTWAGSRYESGGRMADVTLHRFREWPAGMIGPAEILWRPSPALSTGDRKGKRKHIGDPSDIQAVDTRQIWLRLHPSIFDETYTTLVKAITSFYQRGNVRVSEGAGVELRDLRGSINCFELTGPRALQILDSVLHVCRTETSPKKAFMSHLKYAQTPQNVPERTVIGLTVHDPRLSFPPKNAKVLSATDNGQRDTTSYLRFMQPTSELARTSLWDTSRRDALLKPRYRKSDLDKRRQALGIPGKPLSARADDDRLPTILIQRSVECDKEDANTSVHGFSLFVPAGWGMPFWQSLVFTGSLVTGYKERRNQYLEAGKPSFPEDYPNTSAGRAYWATRAATDELRWLRKPMSKRLNFARFQGNDPWKPNWHQLRLAQQHALFTAEEEEVNGVSPKTFETWLLSAWLAQSDQLSIIAHSTVPAVALHNAVNRYREALNLVPIRTSRAPALYQSCLVRGVLTCIDGGSPKDMAFIFRQRDDVADTNFMSGWIGYVLGGTQSLARGKGYAIGMVTLSGLLSNNRSRPDDPGAFEVLIGNRQGGPCHIAHFKVIP